MHANVHTDRAGGGGGSWRLPPDETLQVADPKQKEEQDLFPAEGHNWRSIVFSLLVIGFVITGIITAIYLLGYVDELLYWSGRRMKLDEFLQKDITPQRLPSVWINNQKFVFQADDGGLAVFDTATNSVATLVTNHTMRQINVKGYHCSHDLKEHYLISASWVGNLNEHVSVVWMTRSQNITVVSSCFSPTWKCVEHHTERAPENEWLDILPHPIFSPDGDSFLFMAGIQETGTEHFTHIKHITITQQRMAVISHGRYEVIRILAWDTVNHLVYYLGTHGKKPGQQHLYVVKDPVSEEVRRTEPTCITCDLSDVLWGSRYYYSNCSFFDAFVSSQPYVSQHIGISYYILECKGPGLPLAVVHAAHNHKLMRVLYDTRPFYASKLQELALPSQRSFEIPLPHGTRAAVQLLLPPSWREELRDAAFPVLVEVNGKPGSTSVSEEFKIDWGTYMSSHNDVVYIRLDVRGARGQGKQALYRHLGGVEVQDQIAVLRYLLDTLKFLDETRVGVWGWGYGGYVTAMILGSQQHVFKCGISVSPVTDWLYYNSIFTERILGVPAENYKAYVEADATQKGRQIPSYSYFLIHGLADVTAPYQHGIQLARSLSESGTIFRYLSYADEGHDLTGVIEHVYRSMEDFLRNCLSLDSDEDKPTEANVPHE
uniref:Peptidase S9 prolyl oligopeptidase catalytic domain-containing protein n=1 Tax=Anopheles melas TaxID=34690 RepID=A0A182TIR2_9DIPT